MYLRPKHIITLLFFVVFSAAAFGQPINSFQVNSEGASPQILQVVKHSKGYMLAGTTNGLYRFDGHAFSLYPFNTNIANRAITAIAEIGNAVWIGFQHGEIGQLRNNVVYLMNAEEGHPAVAITSIVGASTGTVYFGTAGEGIYYYTNNRFYNINTDDGMSDNYTYQMLSQPPGIIACTDKGINIINTNGQHKQVKNFTSSMGLADNIVRCMHPLNVSRNNPSYLLGMQDAGIGLYEPLNNHFTDAKNWSFGQVNSLLASGNQLWAATESNGIIQTSLDAFTNKQFNYKKFDSGFSKANNLVTDGEGNIWFSSQQQLVKTNGTQLQNIIPINDQLFGQVHVILSDSKGNIWINDNKGLLRYTFNKQQQQYVATTFNLPLINKMADITSLYEDRFGTIWIGSLGKGIIVLDPVTGKSRSINEEHLLINGSILSISGKGNEIWISSLAGVVHCNMDDSNNNISHPYFFIDLNKGSSNIGSNYIYSIFIDSKDRVWFATDGRGITVYDHGRFRNYNDSNGLKSQVIYNICEDNKGNIWFSALNNGVYKYDGKRFTNLTVSGGLNDATITALAVDNSNHVFAISKKGINIIDANNNTISYIDGNQGINKINTDLNCIASGREVLFVTAKGIYRYSYVAQSLQPKVVLNGVQLFLNDVGLERTRFAYDENNFTFNYFGISYSHPDKLKFQYKLEGLTDEWILTKDNHINFPKLSPGTYTFRVRVSINNQFNHSAEAAYSFTIRKPIWLQWCL